MRTLSLIIVTFTYLLVGAAIFDALEGPNNEQVKEGLVQLRENLKQKYRITEDDYKMIEVLIEERKPHKTGPQWKFAGSLYFAFVTLALIGESDLASLNFLNSLLIEKSLIISSCIYQINSSPRVWTLNTCYKGRKDVHGGILCHRDPAGPHHVPEHRREDEQVE